jgi:hypothetical protein
MAIVNQDDSATVIADFKSYLLGSLVHLLKEFGFTWLIRNPPSQSVRAVSDFRQRVAKPQMFRSNLLGLLQQPVDDGDLSKTRLLLICVRQVEVRIRGKAGCREQQQAYTME